jgi:ABC-type Fe3+/spermidine/putrescine transport system ATPase subunit
LTQVAVTALRKHYAGIAALNGVDLAARSGELVTLLGPSGCGKTTTLRCIAGFLSPDGGDILVDGRSICATPLRHRNFGVVFQNYALFPHMTVAENVAYGLRVRRVPKAEQAVRVAEAMAMVGLGAYADRLPRTLSGGQQQRVALARALVIRPLLLLLDEPLANLDARLRQEMRALIRQVQQDRGITAFYVTHDQAEAMAISDRVAVMEKGRVAQFATPREIYQRPVSQYVASFTGDACQLPVRILAALESGRYQVALNDAPVVVSGPMGLSAGDTRSLMVRPEAVALAEAGIPGVVRNVTFLGAAQHCEIGVGAATLSVLSEANRRVAPGEPVHLRIDPALGWLLPEGAV